jgi:hypothetical protein
MILHAINDNATKQRIRGWLQRQNKIEDIEWIISQGGSAWDVQRAFPEATLVSLERLAQRHNRYDLGRILHRMSVDTSKSYGGKPGPTLYARYKEAS